MPRQPRLEFPGKIYHVMNRGIERRNIFYNKNDYEDFLSRIETSVQKSPNQILAWALMPNHFHLLIRCGAGGVGNLMRRLLTGYATAFNVRHKRAGFLFQNRYKSILCEEDSYLTELVRYIHLNPFRAKIVKDMKQLNEYPYTGHSVLMGKQKRTWQLTEEVWGHFGDTVAAARHKYEQFIWDGQGQGSRPEFIKGGMWASRGEKWRRSERKEIYDSRILGSGEFIERILDEADEKEKRERSLKKKGIEKLMEVIARDRGIRTKELKERSKHQRVSEGKSMLIYGGVEYFGRSQQEMANLTRMTNSPASRARKRGEILFKERGLLKILERL